MSPSGRVESSSTTPEEGLEVEVVRLDGRGRGVGRIGEREVSVDGALPGELVRVSRPRGRRRRRPARLEQVLEPSPVRVAPGCPHFGTCGGCALQHLDWSAQLELKTEGLLAALDGHGVPAPVRLRAPVTCAPWGYRRRARLAVKHVAKKGGVLVGFRERGGHYVSDISSCPVLIPEVGERIGELRRALDTLAARDRIPQIEVAGSERGAALVVRHLDPLAEADRERLCEFARTSGLQIHLQPAGPESTQPLWPPQPPELGYRLPAFALELRHGPMDFAQVNAGVNRELVSTVVALLALTGAERVVELFCGLGNFTLPVATRAGEVVGIEGTETLVARARSNAQANGVRNARFATADLGDPQSARAALDDAGPAERLLLDPPRSGAAEVVAVLAEPLPPRIVYVSCSTQTLARDAAALVERHGYALVEAGIVDMFPHTMHAESVAVFDR